MTPLIEAVDLTKTFDDGTKALRGVSFSIHEGEFVAIMGPSGSGKSTLLHILGFLDPQTSGTYRFQGRTLEDMSQDELATVRNKDLGFIFQQFNLLPRQTVIENVYLPLYYSSVPKGVWRSKALEALEKVGLSHRVSHEAFTLSGGEKQRVAIARALINSPKLIFADEPTGNLDSVSGKGVLEVLETLHKQGQTVVLVTHDQGIGESAERMLLIKDGMLAKDTAQ